MPVPLVSSPLSRVAFEDSSFDHQSLPVENEKQSAPLPFVVQVPVGNARVKQVPVNSNSNMATTGHKLQGMCKDVLIANEWNYRCVIWVYVVLSRVRTQAGLYLMKPLDLDLERSFNVPQNLIHFEQRLKANKERMTNSRHVGFGSTPIS